MGGILLTPVTVRNLKIGEGVPKICVPVTGATKEEILKEIKAPQNYKLDPTPYYFYIVGTTTAQNSNMPEGFETDPNTHAYTRAMKTIL